MFDIQYEIHSFKSFEWYILFRGQGITLPNATFECIRHELIQREPFYKNWHKASPNFNPIVWCIFHIQIEKLKMLDLHVRAGIGLTSLTFHTSEMETNSKSIRDPWLKVYNIERLKQLVVWVCGCFENIPFQFTSMFIHHQILPSQYPIQ